MLSERSQTRKGHTECDSVCETRSDQAEPQRVFGDCQGLEAGVGDGDRAYFGVMNTAVHILIACINSCTVS